MKYIVITSCLWLFSLNLAAQKEKPHYLISGTAHFDWTSQKENSLLGTVNVYTYGGGICIVKNRGFFNEKNSPANLYSFGLLLQQRNEDDTSDSLTYLRRETLIFPFIRLNLPYNFFIDTGPSIYLYSSKYEDITVSSNIFAPLRWATKDFAIQVAVGYHLKFKAPVYLSPVVYFPIVTSTLNDTPVLERLIFKLYLSFPIEKI